MEIEQFIKKLRSCKKSYRYGIENLKLIRYSNIKFNIYLEPKKSICPYCKTDLTKEGKKEIKVIFNNPIENLTIFQCNLFYFLYVLNEVPYDYANYHKCIAGINFIKNIKEVKI
jgi:hypothetical protein